MSEESTSGEGPSNLGVKLSGRHWIRTTGNPHSPRHGNCLFVCTYNCRTIASEQDLRTLLHRSRNIKYDIIALQETKGKTETIRKTDHNELLIIGAKVDRRNIGGVGFLVNLTVHHLVDSYKIISPRIAVLCLEVKDQGNISIINGYAPTSAATDEEKEEFYELLERTVNDEKSYYEVVVGDFNATVGTNDCDEWRLGPHGSSQRNDISTFGDRPCSR
ncbi:hypothetical protein Q1695_015380 [Nippostrongylus brasiliensis]|nr:hypothetical protein Q1695_015380 [Nippostrongylus brasiliensis]